MTRNNILKTIRGDTFEIKFPVIRDLKKKETYKLIEEDRVYFGVMEPNAQFEDSIIRKIYSSANQKEDGTIIIHLNPEDTEYLLQGVYYYTIKLALRHTDPEDISKTISGTETLINKTKFIILD